MSANAGVAAAVVPGYVLAIALIVGLAACGFDCYGVSAADRPFSAKHLLLKPSGKVGIRLLDGVPLLCRAYFRGHPSSRMLLNLRS